MAEWGSSDLLINAAWTRVSPGKPVIPYFMPSSKFYPIPFVFPHIPAAGSCLPTLSVGCSGLCDTRVCLCVHMHVVTPGITDPSAGRSGVGPGFWSDFAQLGQSCVNSVCSRGQGLFSPDSGFQDPLPHHKQYHLPVQVAFFFPLLFINAKVSWMALTVFPYSRVESGHVHWQALWKNTAELVMTSTVQ